MLALQHQINPHFLYNTMEVFSARMELAGLYEESGAIAAFCRMLRYNMNTKALMSTLEEEIGQVKYFAAIQRERVCFVCWSAVPPTEISAAGRCLVCFCAAPAFCRRMSSAGGAGVRPLPENCCRRCLKFAKEYCQWR